MTDTANSASTQRCPYCGATHFLSGICPRVKAIEYYPDGTTKRVEFHAETPMPVAPQPIIGWTGADQTSYTFGAELASNVLNFIA